MIVHAGTARGDVGLWESRSSDHTVGVEFGVSSRTLDRGNGPVERPAGLIVGRFVEPDHIVSPFEQAVRHVRIVEVVLTGRTRRRRSDQGGPGRVIDVHRDAFDRGLTRILRTVAVDVEPHTVADLDRRLVAQHLEIGHAGPLTESIGGAVVGTDTERAARQFATSIDRTDALGPHGAGAVETSAGDRRLTASQRDTAVERLFVEAGPPVPGIELAERGVLATITGAVVVVGAQGRRGEYVRWQEVRIEHERPVGELATTHDITASAWLADRRERSVGTLLGGVEPDLIGETITERDHQIAIGFLDHVTEHRCRVADPAGVVTARGSLLVGHRRVAVDP